MFILYDIIAFFISLIYLPIYLLRRKFHKGFCARWGFVPGNICLDRPIWVHAVSVGEAVAVRGLIEELRKAYPAKKFVISTVTATGNKIAQSIAKEGDFVTYLPLDFSFIAGSVIERINPSLFILAETEIWPNLITCLSKKNIPVITVNGRVSDSSFRGYSLIRFLISPILRKISLLCVQTDMDKERLIKLGVDPERIKITGSMKFDAKAPEAKGNALSYRQKMGILAHEKLFIAASTHPREEELILGAYKSLLNDFQILRLLIAPRHPERATEVDELVKDFGFIAQRTSQLQASPDPGAVFILDTVGELMNYYAAADIVFVAGSFAKIGGHNILEPVLQDKPVLFGRHMFNFRDIAELFLINNAAIRVDTPEELEIKISGLLKDPGAINKMTARAKQLLLKNQGATKRNAELIKTLLK